MFQTLCEGMDLMTDAPIHGLHFSACLQVDDTMREQIEHLFADLLCIVPVLEYIARGEVVPDLIKIFHKLMRVLIGFKLLGHLRQRGRFKHVDDEHRVVSSKRATALRDDIGMGQVVLVGGIYKSIDTVIDIFLDGVVHGTLT